jgi:hypothetical protein
MVEKGEEEFLKQSKEVYFFLLQMPTKQGMGQLVLRLLVLA